MAAYRKWNPTWLSANSTTRFAAGKAPCCFTVDEVASLWGEHPEAVDPDTPRYRAVYGRVYSGGSPANVAPPAALAELIEWANAVGYGTFNQFEVQWYEDDGQFAPPAVDAAEGMAVRSPVMLVAVCEEGARHRTVALRLAGGANALSNLAAPCCFAVMMNGPFRAAYAYEVPASPVRDSDKWMLVVMRQIV